MDVGLLGIEFEAINFISVGLNFISRLDYSD